MPGSGRQYDVVVWGATGFTGTLACEYLLKNYRGKVRWAMAGRSKPKLESVRQGLRTIHPSADEIPVLLGDIQDARSLRAITAQTLVILTTAGPYARLGTPVVEACIQERTHYCDLTAEWTWIKSLLCQHDRAAQAGCKIVTCCGFDSVPSDLGAQMVVDHMKAHLGRPTKSVTTMFTEFKGSSSAGTVASFGALLDLPPAQLKEAEHPYYLNPPGSQQGPDRPLSCSAHWEAVAGSYAAPFMMAPTNTRVVRRSAALLGDSYGDGFSYNEYLGLAWGAAAYALAALFRLILGAMKFTWVRRQFVARFTGGPAISECEQGKWRADVYAQSQEATGQPSQVVRGVMQGLQDPGYLDTSKIISEAAICLALQSQECEQAGYLKGGILTPASAMGSVLRKRLQHAGFTFRIEQ